MKSVFFSMALITISMSLVSGCATKEGFSFSSTLGKTESSEKAKDTLKIISDHLENSPDMVVNLTSISGEYCINTWGLGGGHMTHYAIDPSVTHEDVIDFVKAQSFIDAGVDVTRLPLLPNKLGTMKNGQWYYLPVGGVDPHHGRKTPIALVVRATDIR